MKRQSLFILLFLHGLIGFAQAPAPGMTVARIKTELEQSPNPILYTKQVLKKRFKIDTITVANTSQFSGLADSLAYKGKEKKVYGPYGKKGNRYLVQILSKAPNVFYRISQIFIDTSVFRRRIADSLGRSIVERIRSGSASFGQMAAAYSMGGESRTNGDLGWIARGILLPQIEHEVSIRKKGDVFMLWSSKGLHIIQKTEDDKKDTGFALVLQIFL